jgi:hypothetical protein
MRQTSVPWMRRIAAAAAGIALMIVAAPPVQASATVTNIQYREQGVHANLTNIPGMGTAVLAGIDPDHYFFISFGAGPGEATGHNYPGSVKEMAYIDFGEWDEDWNQLVSWSGYAPVGAPGFDMAQNASWATASFSMPVGYCARYEGQDDEITVMDTGGPCIDYVTMGTAAFDLTFTAASKLMHGGNTESWGEPGEWRYVNRYTGHYRDALLSGSLTLPGLEKQEVSSDLATIYLKAIGSLDLYVGRGAPRC